MLELFLQKCDLLAQINFKATTGYNEILTLPETYKSANERLFWLEFCLQVSILLLMSGERQGCHDIR